MTIQATQNKATFPETAAWQSRQTMPKKTSRNPWRADHDDGQLAVALAMAGRHIKRLKQKAFRRASEGLFHAGARGRN
jgi:hypothetical protein